MKKIVFVFSLFAFILSFTACGSAKKVRQQQAQKIVNHSKLYVGTPYKWGGTNKSGIDCSGLIQNSYAQAGIDLPRTAKEMSKTGKRTRLKKVKLGDLIFFSTKKRGRKITHVGLVVEVTKNDIKFIHSTTSRGVLISSMNENYWNDNYRKARTIF
ncbi:MAG: C40 family peptidase [Bacteroidota bacterium]